MTTGIESDPHDEALAKAWRARSQDLPPPALDATILAAAHRAVGSGPRDARKQAMEATRPQRWWMPLAAAATVGVVVIGILQIAPQAPVDIVVGERAEVAGRVAPALPAAPEKDAAQGSVAAPLKDAASAKNVGQANTMGPTTTAPSTAMLAPVAREKKATADVALAPRPSAAPSVLADARKQGAAAPSTPAPEPFPADKLSSKLDAQSTARQNERKDAAEAVSAPAPYNEAAKRSEARAPSASARLAAPAPAPVAAPAPATAPMAAPAPMVAQAPAPAAASPELARSTASPAELQARARDPEAWIVRIRKLRADGRIAEAVAELRELRRYVPDAESRLPADLRQWVPIP